MLPWLCTRNLEHHHCTLVSHTHTHTHPSFSTCLRKLPEGIVEMISSFDINKYLWTIAESYYIYLFFYFSRTYSNTLMALILIWKKKQMHPYIYIVYFNIQI
jgi:hypothetical protein